ncbi:F-box only protein 48 isoform X1 [Motacilla alba alba]|uniref:F-box only protein 48 isoform X1 n=1 Tax=Motacilla alba alba TaxID=1094192 RepID=UPI0018D5956E|nr:F-box only protein 48 isoform X1 [Motacilla alba alba]
MTRGRPVTCSFPGPRGGAASVVPKLRRFVPKSAPHAHTRGGRATGTWRQAGTQPRALPAAAARTQRGGSDASPPHTEAAGMDAKRAPGRDSAEGGKGGLGDFVSALPPEITSRIFSGLDVESLCHASVTCKGWHRVIESNEQLWRHHCLAVRAVCQREIDCDRRNGYSWKVSLHKASPGLPAIHHPTDLVFLGYRALWRKHAKFLCAELLANVFCPHNSTMQQGIKPARLLQGKKASLLHETL